MDSSSKAKYGTIDAIVRRCFLPSLFSRLPVSPLIAIRTTYGSKAEKAYLLRLMASAMDSKKQTYDPEVISAGLGRISRSHEYLSLYRKHGTVSDDLDPPKAAGRLSDEALLAYWRPTDEGRQKLKADYINRASSARQSSRASTAPQPRQSSQRSRPRRNRPEHLAPKRQSQPGITRDQATRFPPETVGTAAFNVLTEGMEDRERETWSHFFWKEETAWCNGDCRYNRIVTMFNSLTTHDSAEEKEARFDAVCSRAGMTKDVKEVWRAKVDLTSSLTSQFQSNPS